MKKQIVNNKVLKGIAIAMSAMMAITSVPVGSLAAGTGATENTEQAVTIEDAINAVDKAEDEVEQHFEGTNEESQLDQAVIKDLDNAEAELNKIEVNEEGLVVVLVESDVADQNLKALDESLKSEYLESDTKDKAKADRLQYDVARDEEEQLITDADGNPSVETGSAQLQLSGQYGDDNRSVQGVYQSGMGEIQKAIEESKNGNEDKAKEHLAKAGEYLSAANSKFANSTEKLTEAETEYAAAKEALDKIEEQIGEAVKYSQEASKYLEDAQKKAEKLEKMRDQYYALMLRYFNDEVKTATFDENGKLDVEQSAAKASELNNNKVNKTQGIGNDTFYLGRELLEQLVTYKLEDEGATNIVFEAGIKGDPNSKPEKTAVITKDNEGNDKIGKYKDAGIHKWESGVGDNGRNNHVKVTYIDGNNQEQTKYFNYIIKAKDKDYEGSDVDFENGVIYVSEIKKEGDTWKYTKYNPDSSEYLDNYNALVKAADDYKNAKAAVDEAAEKVKKLKEEINIVNSKVATNKEKIAELSTKLEKAQEAYNNSKDNLKDFQDVYDQMLRTLYPEEYSDGPDVVEPIEEEPITEPGVITTPGGADDPADNAGGDSDVDASEGATTNTITIPSVENLAGVAGLGTVNTRNNNGVAGVRVDENNGGAADQGIVQVDDNQVAKAATAPVKTDDKKTDTKKVTKLENNQVPLANMPGEDSAEMNWWWLLVVFLLGALGKKMYDEHKKKMESKESM